MNLPLEGEFKLLHSDAVYVGVSSVTSRINPWVSALCRDKTGINVAEFENSKFLMLDK